MDCMKIGRLLAQLRCEKDLTQKQLGDALGVSNKTVSKWECGLGCPDLSLWSDLSGLLGVDMAQLMEGEIVCNKPDNGNMGRVHFYVCPACGNLLTATGSASVFCCGKKVEALEESDAPAPQIEVEQSDGEWFVHVEHPMQKEHFLSFAAAVSGDRLIVQKLYPEQDASFRVPASVRGRLVLYCTRDGMFTYPKAFYPKKMKQ